jgi:hypothetical protein
MEQLKNVVCRSRRRRLTPKSFRAAMANFFGHATKRVTPFFETEFKTTNDDGTAATARRGRRGGTKGVEQT